MSYLKHMAGYSSLRTLYHFDKLAKWQEGKDFNPIAVEISPTHSCNHRCRHCYAWQRGSTKDCLKLDGVFPQLEEMGIGAIELQGTGEPLINPKLPSSFKGCKIPTGLVTNGVLFTPSTQSEMLPGLAYVKYSVIDSDPYLYAFSHGCRQNDWETLIENMKNAVALRTKEKLDVAFIATHYLDRNNFKNAYEAVRFFKNLGLDYIVVQEATFSHNSPAGYSEYASKGFNLHDISNMKDDVSKLNSDTFQVRVRFPLNTTEFCVGLDGSNWKKGYCQGIKFSTLIGSDGEIYPCWRMWGRKEYSYGSIYSSSIQDIWKSKTRKEIEQYILETPPDGIGNDSECNHCNITKLNDILYKANTSNSKWKGFILQ